MCDDRNVSGGVLTIVIASLVTIARMVCTCVDGCGGGVLIDMPNMYIDVYRYIS